jgi:hypothetical protein
MGALRGSPACLTPCRASAQRYLRSSRMSFHSGRRAQRQRPTQSQPRPLPHLSTKSGPSAFLLIIASIRSPSSSPLPTPNRLEGSGSGLAEKKISKTLRSNTKYYRIVSLSPNPPSPPLCEVLRDRQSREMFTPEGLAAQAMPKPRRKAVGHRITAGATRPMTRRIISRRCAPSKSHRMWHRTHVAQNKSPQPP